MSDMEKEIYTRKNAQMKLEAYQEELEVVEEFYFDENEHEIPWDYINFMHMAMRATGAGSLVPRERKKRNGDEQMKRPPIGVWWSGIIAAKPTVQIACACVALEI